MPTWLNQQWLWLLLVAPACLLLPVLTKMFRARMAKSWGTPEHRGTYTQPLPAVRHWLKAVGLSVLVAAAALALARPVVTNQQVQFPADAADVIVLIDNSRSMYAADSANNQTRMQTAKDVAKKRILPVMGSNRVAIILFAGEAKTVAYLDQARPAVSRAIDMAITPSSMPGDGSALGDAFKLAFRHFDIDSDGAGTDPKLNPAGAKKGTRKKVIVLLSDGGSDDKTSYPEIIAGCQERSVQLMVFGFGGNAPAQIPVKELSADDQRLADSPFYKVDGSPATTSIDERLLSWLADTLRPFESVYIRVHGYEDAQFDHLITGVEMQTRLSQRELYHYPLAVCLPALLLAYLAIALPVRQRKSPVDTSGAPDLKGDQS